LDEFAEAVFLGDGNGKTAYRMRTERILLKIRLPESKIQPGTIIWNEVFP